jgi:hypothetical protein
MRTEYGIETFSPYHRKRKATTILIKDKEFTADDGAYNKKSS